MSALLAVALIALAATGIGRLTLDASRTELPRPAAAIPCAFALGLAILFYVQFAAGLAGLLGSTAQWGLLLAAVAGGSPGLVRVGRDLRALAPALRPRGRFELLVAAWAAAILVVALAGALAPPHDPDSLDYHLPFAERFHEAGRLVHLSYLETVKAAFPPGIELLFSMALAVGGDTAPAVLEFVSGVLLLLLLAAEARRVASPGPVGRRTAIVVAAMLLASPAYEMLLGTAFVDLIFFLTAAASMHLAGRRAAGPAALLAGFAACSKPVLGLLPIAVGVIVSWSAGGARGDRGMRLATVARFTGIAGLGALPWPLFRWVTTGNPVYPFLFGGHEAPLRVYETLTGQQRDSLFTIVEVVLGHVPQMTASKFALSSGPMLLAMVPLVFALGAVRRRVPVSVALGGATLAIVLILNARLRFLLLPVVYLVPALALTWEALLGAGGNVGRAARATLLVGIVWGGLHAVKLHATNVPYALGLESREAYLRRWFRDYPLILAANRDVPAGGAVLRMCRPDTYDYYDRFRIVRPEPLAVEHGVRIATATSFRELLDDRGVTHIIDCAGKLGIFFADEAEELRFRDGLDEVARGGLKTLLRIRTEPDR